MAENRTYANPPLRLMFAGDRRVGIIITSISAEGIRTTLIENDAIELYAKKNQQSYDEVFSEIVRSLYFIAEVCDASEPINSNDIDQLKALSAESEKVKDRIKGGEAACMVDFCFIVEPQEGDFEMGRFNVFIDVISEAIDKSGAGDFAVESTLGPVIKGILNGEQPTR